MRALGFRYVVGPPETAAAQAPAENEPYLPGVGPTRTEALAVAQRKQAGYHLFAAYAPASSSSIPPNDQYVRTLSPAQQVRYSRALFGPESRQKTLHLPFGATYTFPTSGCIAKGQAELYGSAEAAQYVVVLPQSLLAQVSSATLLDRAVVAKSRNWSRCVSKATAESFKTPHDIIERLQREYATQGPTQAVRNREIAYAVADTRCQFRTGLATVYAKVFRREADQLAGRTRRLLLQTLEAEQQATARAERILSSAGAG